jgi:hypothetical protein
MERLIPRIREIADNIFKTETKRKRLASFLKEVGQETEILQRLEPSELEDVRVAGVDGGLAKKSLHGFDCILVRAAATCFHYKNGKRVEVKYFPSRVPAPKADLLEALSDLDWAHFASIMRQGVEVRTALKALDSLNPNILLMDGSIVPHYSDRPARTSDVYSSYRSMLDDFMNLYRTCLDRGITLAGVIEDSRGTSYCSLINQEILSRVNHGRREEMVQLLEKTRDTNLLYWMLDKGERSRVFQYSNKPDEHPVLRDFGNLAERINSFYLKTAQYDRPVRVDMLARGSDVIGEADRLGSVLLAISGHHSGYGLPVPLIEADNVAKLSENEIENFYSHILSFAGNIPSVMRLRREQRPF